MAACEFAFRSLEDESHSIEILLKNSADVYILNKKGGGGALDVVRARGSDSISSSRDSRWSMIFEI